MKTKMKLKIGIDILMTAGLLFLMSYELVGRAEHEWIGTGLFFLFILHHILNRKWTSNLFKGRYTKFRILQTIVAVTIFISMLGSMISGILLSEYVFADIRIKGVANIARNIHMICAYWEFILMSFHLGMHWNILLSVLNKKIGFFNGKKKYKFQILAGIIAIYGYYAFVKRQIGSYMFLKIHLFVFAINEKYV